MIGWPDEDDMLIFRYFVAAIIMLPMGDAAAQSFKRAGTEFNAVRTVTVAAGKPYTIVVTEFFHHGEIRPDGKNLAVVAGKKLMPMRILQLGPGDVCRLAFQTIPGQLEYNIYYGGEPPTETPPPWTCRDGLLLETRQYQACNFFSFDSVRAAFDKAKPIGLDYVDAVFHGFNPMTLKNEPFLSRYSGTMDIRQTGVYGFILSSRDCSFLLIDDKLVASSPGYHGPMYQALRGSRHDVKLATGEHKFEFYHAAGGDGAVMVVAWEVDPKSEKPQNVTLIPSEVFHSYLVAHLPTTQLSTRTAKQSPDFFVKIVNDIPLPDNDVPLVGVLFRDCSVTALTMQGAKLQWDFGDGQTSHLPNVDHVYLRPGVYPVKLSIRRGAKTIETTNRVNIDRPHLSSQDKRYSFDDYLKIIEEYDPKTLDTLSLRQLVLAFEAKATVLASQAEDAAQKVQEIKNDPNRRPRPSFSDSRHHAVQDTLLAESNRYLARAVDAGKTAFIGKSVASGDQDLLQLAQWIGPTARERLGDSETAFQIWQGVAERIQTAPLKAECEIAAADIALNDLLKTAEAKSLLESAAKQIDTSANSPMAANFNRVWGDYNAATGDGPSARKAYAKAEQTSSAARPANESTAARGAHARSTEEFVRQKQFDRAAEELQAWQREYPTEKNEGYWTLLAARYWAGRGKYAQAIAQVEQLQAVNPDSPYVDQALLLAADSEMRRGRKDRALATLHALVKDYPGSPLAPLAKKNIDVLKKDGREKDGREEKGEGRGK
jgi:TolA-binding protein